MTTLSIFPRAESAVETQQRVMHATLLGTGSALPHRVIDNRYFVDELGLDTSPDWIVSKTGIEERRYAERGQDVVSLAADAGLSALEASGLTPDQLDLIIVATSSSPYAMPSVACLVQETLDATHALAFDLNNACAGFAFALDAGIRYLQTGPKNALIIGADLGSRLVDPRDRGTVIFFGDGAGAAVLSAEGDGRVLASRMFSRGTCVPLHVPTGGTMKMDGRAIWQFVNEILPTTIRQLCDDAQVCPSEISLLVPHQANSKMIAAATESLGIPLDRIALNLHRYGNTLAGSIPIALDESVRAGRVQSGDLVLTIGFGAGLAWGGSLLQI
jgi:3-oxoacyl-[acyl-carrier-protein] synthase-3